METKTCGRCKKDLPLSSFNKNKAKKCGLNSYCRDCNKIAHKEHYKAKPEFYYNRNKKVRLSNAQWIFEYKCKNKCKQCGEKHPACLQFHHRDENEKSFEISRAGTKKLETIIKEIEKCDLVCANCHFKIHYKKHGT